MYRVEQVAAQVQLSDVRACFLDVRRYLSSVVLRIGKWLTNAKAIKQNDLEVMKLGLLFANLVEADFFSFLSAEPD